MRSVLEEESVKKPTEAIDWTRVGEGEIEG